MVPPRTLIIYADVCKHLCQSYETGKSAREHKMFWNGREFGKGKRLHIHAYVRFMAKRLRLSLRFMYGKNKSPTIRSGFL